MVRAVAMWGMTAIISLFFAACEGSSHTVKTDKETDNDVIGTTDDIVTDDLVPDEEEDTEPVDKDSVKDSDVPKDSDVLKDSDTPIDEDVSPIDDDGVVDEEVTGPDEDTPIEDPCLGVTCSGHGTCMVDQNNAPYCVCEENYSPFGLECLPTANPCAPVTCSGHGTCSLVEGQPVCTCDEGYVPLGLQCVVEEDPCEGITCSGHGTCVLGRNGISCVCDTNYVPFGLECVPAANPCEGITCSGRGTCVVEDGVPVCNCPADFYAAGPYCVNQCTDAEGIIEQGKSCEDNQFCNGLDYCNASGKCLVHQYTDLNARCNDDEFCTADSCNEDLDICENVPLTNTPCDDHLFCTQDDKCTSQGECAGTLIDCSDPYECTIDSCKELSDGYECVHDNAIEGTPCGDSTDTECDNPDTCDGEGTCVPNLELNTTECRTAAGSCDTAEYCTGDSRYCPDDAFADADTVCRGKAGSCDVAEYCPGDGPDCPENAFEPETVQCRAATGECDVAEYCTGDSADCPNNEFEPNTTVCRAQQGACDAPETCTGNAAQCPNDVKYGSTVVCRPAEGPCDIAETCPGNSNDCPGDAVHPNTYECRPAVDPSCDFAEKCDGTHKTCPEDSYVPNGTNCEGDDNLCTHDACLNGRCIVAAEGTMREVSTNWPDDQNPISLYNNGTCFDSWCDPSTGTLSYDSFVTHSDGKSPVVCDTGFIQPGDGFCQDIPQNSTDPLPEGCCKVCDRVDFNGECTDEGSWDSTCCLPIGSQKVDNACCIGEDNGTKIVFVLNDNGTCPDDGLKCTDDACDENGFCIHLIQKGFCVIENRCYQGGDLNPANSCEICKPGDDQASKVNWTAVPDDEPCMTPDGLKGACKSTVLRSFCVPQ